LSRASQPATRPNPASGDEPRDRDDEPERGDGERHPPRVVLRRTGEEILDEGQAHRHGEEDEERLHGGESRGVAPVEPCSRAERSDVRLGAVPEDAPERSPAGRGVLDARDAGVVRLAPPLAEAEVEAFERRHAVELPADYRSPGAHVRPSPRAPETTARLESPRRVVALTGAAA
jgi:hypothetical protein